MGIGAGDGHPNSFFVPFVPLCERKKEEKNFSHKGTKGTKKGLAASKAPEDRLLSMTA
jgi:hypothetical protein